MSENKPLVLVDGSSYLYRAFHAMPALTNSQGEPTGAVYGVVNMLRRLLNDYDPEHVAVIFDAKGKTFRDDLFAEYKANRARMPDELSRQIPVLHEVIEAMGLPLIIEPGVEADDVIGTLTVQAREAGMAVLISTGDKDMAQLVDGGVTLVNTMTDTVMDADGVVEKFGVPAERIIDYLALIGDTSDNVPGIPKCGPKTAVKWLTEYGSLDGVIANADSIKGKVGEYLRESLDQLGLSRELVTIRCDVPLHESLDDLQRQAPDTARLRELYGRLEFKGWLAEVIGQGAGGTEPAGKTVSEFQIIDTEAAFSAWLERLKGADLIALDIETTSLNYKAARVVGFSFAVDGQPAAYLPLAHEGLEQPKQLDRDTCLDALKPILEDPDRPKVGQNLKYDMNVLVNHGIELRGVVHDTMLESYVLDSTATRHDLDSLALKYLGRRNISYEDVAGKGVKQIPFEQVAVEDAARYAAEDAEVALALHHTLWPRLEPEARMADLYREVEIPLVPVLSKMECTGVLVDVEMLRRQSHELEQRMVEIERAAFEEAGEAFNLGSPKQIQSILFDQLGLPVLAKTAKGQPSTAENVLQELALDYTLPKLILEHRGMAKLKSTYTDKLPQLVDPTTGRVHTSYHQAVAATGRLSSSEPNLQNIPVRTAEGRRIRQAFIAPSGYRLLAADYSQIELRIMAHLSGDESLLKAFAEGRDIHRATAAEVFGRPQEELTSEERRSAKAINFGLIYGMSAFGLARQLGIGRAEAQEYVDRYFERYPGVREYMDRTREEARANGYVETVYGRRLHIPEINAGNAQRRQYAERTAINAPMQGTAADIIKRAMIHVDRWLREQQVDARMIMQVHDELVFEVADSQVAAVREEVIRLMAEAGGLSVPLEVEAQVGANWDEAH